MGARVRMTRGRAKAKASRRANTTTKGKASQVVGALLRRAKARATAPMTIITRPCAAPERKVESLLAVGEAAAAIGMIMILISTIRARVAKAMAAVARATVVAVGAGNRRTCRP